AKVVCTPCNNNWMSDLENDHARPAMQDLHLGNNSATLGPTEVAALSAYAFKTTVVANHKTLRRPVFFSAGERFKFRTTLSIPSGIQIWLACRKSVRYNGMWTSSFGKFDRKTVNTF